MVGVIFDPCGGGVRSRQSGFGNIFVKTFDYCQAIVKPFGTLSSHLYPCLTFLSFLMLQKVQKGFFVKSYLTLSHRSFEGKTVLS